METRQVVKHAVEAFLGRYVRVITDGIAVDGTLISCQPSMKGAHHSPDILVLELQDGSRVILRSFQFVKVM